MHTIKRNDPCYCGSGKKYKKCCGKKENNESIQSIMEREVVQVQSELLKHSFSYPQFAQKVQQVQSLYNPPTRMKDTFSFFVSVWALFTSKVIDEKTALLQYCSSRLSKWRPKVQEIVHSWIGQSPSAVRVENVEGRNLVVRDIFSKDNKKIKLIDEVTEVPNQGSLLFGYIVPFSNDVFVFFTSFLTYEDQMADYVEKFLQQKFTQYVQEKKPNGGREEDVAPLSAQFLTDHFVELVNLFMSDEDFDVIEQKETQGEKLKEELPSINRTKTMDSLNKQALAVVNLLEEKIQHVDMPKSVVETGATLWQSYYLKKQPIIKNEKIYAAALHYLLVDKLYPIYRLTQKATAELYDTSMSSVSSRSREMACVLEQELKELCAK